MDHRKITVQASWHLFGSVKGYTTLNAADDVSDDERKFLQTLGFGQGENSSYNSSLEDDPAAMGRPLPTGRYALTRVFRGDPDTAGRPTYLFASLIFSNQDWVEQVALNIPACLNHLPNWNFRQEPAGAVINTTIPGSRRDLPPKDLLCCLVDSSLCLPNKNALIALTETGANNLAVLSLAMALPPVQRQKLSWSIRALNQSVPVNVATYHGTSLGHSPRTIVHLTNTPSIRHRYTEYLSFCWKDPGALPHERINQVNDATNSDLLTLTTQNLPDDQPNRRSARSRIFLISGLVAMLLIAIILLCLRSAYISDPTSQPVTENIEQLPSKLQEHLARYDYRGELTQKELNDWHASAQHTAEKTPETDGKYQELKAAIAAVEAFQIWIRNCERIIQETDNNPNDLGTGLLTLEERKRLKSDIDEISELLGNEEAEQYQNIVKVVQEKLQSISTGIRDQLSNDKQTAKDIILEVTSARLEDLDEMISLSRLTITDRIKNDDDYVIHWNNALTEFSILSQNPPIPDVVHNLLTDELQSHFDELVRLANNLHKLVGMDNDSDANTTLVDKLHNQFEQYLDNVNKHEDKNTGAIFHVLPGKSLNDMSPSERDRALKDRGENIQHLEELCTRLSTITLSLEKILEFSDEYPKQELQKPQDNEESKS